MIIEDLITSKTRVKILKLFLADIEHRYYLRELERTLDESLSPLRRQLVKLVKMGILLIEEEANLKYYSLNKNFAGLEELRRLVLGAGVLDSAPIVGSEVRSNDIEVVPAAAPTSEVDKVAMKKIEKQFRYDALLLTGVSIVIAIAAIFLVYTGIKNTKLLAGLAIHAPVKKVAVERSVTNGEMASKNWKILPGNVPALSEGGAGLEKNTKEL